MKRWSPGAALRLIALLMALLPASASLLAGNLPSGEPNSAAMNAAIRQQLLETPLAPYDAAEAERMASRILELPQGLLDALIDAHVRIRLINGRLTDEPEMLGLRGQTPRGWEHSGLTWDDIPGIGGKLVILRIGYSDHGRGHGSVNLELHETFHAVDTHVLGRLSASRIWRLLFEQEAQSLFAGTRYEERYPEEYFAEASAMMFYSPETRADVAVKAPATYRFLHGLFRVYE
ncbi:hypothetical protein PA598K_00214 [Paenibacillus sp. 598K]|uniref:anthrax toxin lethal factor-related metalloendopeptidase n=1 Tax=Paenibacillus sp. 598K TaxID=1117987 RepID=UPI000FF9FC59|nr:hypothetical protein [Paenibacillus sp. 598K]GBF71984.1 hypothetical protein PA598K_00214 [Paenibacillus sp. 598K]